MHSARSSQLERSAIGKCRRLARLSPAHGRELQLRSLHAPPEFTLKACSFLQGGRIIIESRSRNSRNGTGTGTIQTPPRNHSSRSLANRMHRPGTPTVLGGRAGNTAPLNQPPAVDLPNPDSPTRKTVSTQGERSKQNRRSDPTSRTTIRRRLSHQFRRNLSYTLNITMQSKAEYRGSQTQISPPVPMSFLLIQCPCHTGPVKAPSLSYAISSLTIYTTLATKFHPSTSFPQVNLP